MSTFNGNDLFGSGVHNIEFGDVAVASFQQGFPGVQGIVHFTGGFRGRAGKITGTLRDTTAAGIETKIKNILAYIVDGTSATLVDNFSRSYGDVVLKGFSYRGKLIRVPGTTVQYIQDYEVSILQCKLS